MQKILHPTLSMFIVEVEMKPVGKHYNLTRFKTYSMGEILPLFRKNDNCLGKKNPEASRIFDGKRVKFNSLRYQLFANKGTKCVACGLEAQFFALEQSHSKELSDTWHFNLYGRDSDGDEILFTKDHILSRAKGGKDHINNLQTMCYVCNQIKGG